MFETGTSIRRSDSSVVGGLSCWDVAGFAVNVLYRMAEATPTLGGERPEPNVITTRVAHATRTRALLVDSGRTDSLCSRGPADDRPSAPPGLAAETESACRRQETPLRRSGPLGLDRADAHPQRSRRDRTRDDDRDRSIAAIDDLAAGLSGNPSGVGGSGVWKTTDGGSNWFPIADSLPSLKVAAIALAPDLPSRIYAALVDIANAGSGLYRSDDSGTTWTLIADDSRLNGRQLLIDASNPPMMFMASAAGVHRSSDGGTHGRPY